MTNAKTKLALTPILLLPDREDRHCFCVSGDAFSVSGIAIKDQCRNVAHWSGTVLYDLHIIKKLRKVACFSNICYRTTLRDPRLSHLRSSLVHYIVTDCRKLKMVI